MNPHPSNSQQGSLAKRLGLDRNRVIAIGSLTLILVVVLVVQFGGGANESNVATARPTSKKTKPAVGKRKTDPSETSQQAPRDSASSRSSSTRGRSRMKSRSARSPSPPKAESVIKNKAAKEQQSSSEDNVPESTQDSTARPDWPDFDFANVQDSNPFGLPPELEKLKKEKAEKEAREKKQREEQQRRLAEQQRQARIQQAIANLQQRGIRMVFIQGDQRVVQIGSQVVKQGDLIDGVRIAEILENGSVILEVPEPESR